MLVLTRKLGESVIIAGDIEVIVLSQTGCQVKLGLKAPPGISIHRREVHERILEETNNRKMTKT